MPHRSARSRWLCLAVGGLALVFGARNADAGDDKEKQKEQPKRPDITRRFDDIIKRLEGIDPEQAKKLKAALEKAMEGMKGADQLKQLRANIRPGARGGAPEDRRFGATLTAPSDTLVEQLGLAKGKGLVLEKIGVESAAAKGGLKAHDILVELNGKAVPND